MIEQALQHRNEAERRSWVARDEVTRRRLLLLDAQAVEAIATRELDRAQEFLSMLYADLGKVQGVQGEAQP
jgi:hypothetical protein